MTAYIVTGVVALALIGIVGFFVILGKGMSR